MKKVYEFELKNLIIPLSIYLGIMFIIGATVLLPTTWVSWRQFSTLMGCFIIGLVIGVTLLCFSYNKKRVSADMSYSLPATKRDLFLGKYFASITAIFVGIIIYFILCLVLFMFANIDQMEIPSNSLQIFLKCCLIYLGTVLPLFHFVLLFYYKGNTILDGIAFVACGLGIVFMVLGLICRWAKIYSPQFIFSLFIEAPGDFFVDGASLVYIIYYTICVILGYALIIYLIWFSSKDCSIRTQEISNGIFGYKVFLPVIGFLLPILTSTKYFDTNCILFLLTGVGAFISYCVYHRSIKFSRLSYIILGLILSYNIIYYLFATTM